MIVSGELSGGDRLNETLLAERFGVSRGPVREACRGLERSGLIRFVANRGVFVREMNVKEALELFDVRAALFALAGKTLAPSIADAQVQRLAALIGEMSAAAEADDVNASYHLNIEVHTLMIDRADEHTSELQSLMRRLH